MSRKILGVLIGCVATMLGLVVAVGVLGGGLDRQLVARAEAEITNFNSAKAVVQQARSEVDNWVKADPGLFKNGEMSAEWNTQFDASLKHLEEGQKNSQQLRTLLNTKDSDKEKEIQNSIYELASVRMSATNEASGIRDQAKRLVDFKKEIDQKLPQLAKDIDAIKAINLATVQTAVDRAVTDWPEKKVDLTNRLNSYKTLKASAEKAWESTAEARQRVSANEVNADDVEYLIQTADTLHQSKTTLQSSPKTMNDRIDQLYWSWDKVFEDMEIVEGSTVTFRQKFRTTKVRATVSNAETTETKPPETKTLDDEWKTVSKQTFEKMKSMQGMTVEHKPAGKFDEEAEREVQPPGYAYIAPRGQRNRYGEWRQHSNGSSFWAFYGQYSFMRNMLGGPRYHYVTPVMYRDYSERRGTGRPYYGKDNYGRQVYGSGGSATKEKYAASRYVASSGFKNTNYVKSGGTYRGSKYNRKASSSSRSSSSARRSSSSSYRSSRSSGFRSGGFGGK